MDFISNLGNCQIVNLLAFAHNKFMELEEKKYWLGFSAFEGIGPVRFKLLWEYFGSAKSAFLAPAEVLEEVGLGKKLVEKFVFFRRSFDLDDYLHSLKHLGIITVCLPEKTYPPLLKEIEDPPPLLYIKVADLTAWEELLSLKVVSVVGTRKITDYGRKTTQTIVRGLVKKGFLIVSGLARGVDRVAHEAAIENMGKTLAIFGTGLETVYPSEHQALAEKIVKSGGALVSEFPLAAKISKGNFVTRNRIISGLSLGVVITQAAERSGSLITASFAGRQGREVFAVPGPVTSSLSAGTASLIQKGAKLVYNVGDILEELV